MSPPVSADWDSFVQAHPRATFFHLAAWGGLTQRLFGHRPHLLEVRRGTRLAAVLPLVEIRSRLFGHALISNAFCTGGGPLAESDSALQEILARAERLGQELGVDYIELRDAAHARAGWTTRDDLYAGFERPIAASEDDALKQIPKKQRAVLRKALERGLTTTIDADAEDFHRLYARTMRNHGTPALPRRFFEELLSTFPGACEILTVRRDGQPLSSVLSYYFRGRVLPHYTGAAPEAREFGSNDLMYWTLMRRAAGLGATVFDFGRSKRGTGPFSFKQNWGFEPRPIAHQYRLVRAAALPNVNPTNPKYRALIGAWRRLPLPVANAVSPLLSRSLA